MVNIMASEVIVQFPEPFIKKTPENYWFQFFQIISSHPT